MLNSFVVLGYLGLIPAISTNISFNTCNQFINVVQLYNKQSLTKVCVVNREIIFNEWCSHKNLEDILYRKRAYDREYIFPALFEKHVVYKFP